MPKFKEVNHTYVFEFTQRELSLIIGSLNYARETADIDSEFVDDFSPGGFGHEEELWEEMEEMGEALNPATIPK